VSIQSIHSSVPPPETSVIFVDKTNISQVQDIRKVWLSKFFSNLTILPAREVSIVSEIMSYPALDEVNSYATYVFTSFENELIPTCLDD
jgi:hypothetical protein